MSLSHALLTSLLEKPASGLELAKRFDRSIGYFWNATHQQIYRELALMEKSGWVKSLPPQKGRGRKKVYKVLQKGKKELTRWVQEKDDTSPMRSELMVRLRADALIGPTDLQEEVKRQQETHQNKLDIYLEIEEKDFSSEEKTRQERIQHAVLSAGIMHEKYWIEVCQMVMDALSEDEENG